MITDIIDRNVAKVMTLFSLSPGSKFLRNEIKEKTMLNNVPLDNALNILLCNKIIEKKKRMLFLNHRNKFTKTIVNILKEEFEKFKELPLEVYYLLMDVSYSLIDIKNVKQAYLFGSYAKLIHTSDSDIDLAIILSRKDRRTVTNAKRVVKKIEKKYGKVVEEHFFEKSDLKQKDLLIKEILRNNVQLF